ncbi:MAG: sigma-70 family RNA polymerase sigma factor [Candidatus Caldarchaeum sp.]
MGAAKMTAEEFEELYQQFWGLVYSKCLASLGDIEEALDATMEVFIRKWCAIDRYDPQRASFKAWLIRNTDHYCIDLMRKRSHRDEVSLEEALESYDEQAEPITHVDDLVNIRIALSHLDPFDRQLVLMRFVEEYTWDEISQLTGLTVAQVRHRIDNALSKLRRWLGVSEEEPTKD